MSKHKKEPHCIKCGNKLVVSDPNNRTMKFCNKCGFDLTSMAKKDKSDKREKWVNYCSCGAKCFEDAPICSSCGSNLSVITLKKVPPKPENKLSMMEYLQLVNASSMLLSVGAGSGLVEDGVEIAKESGGFFKSILKEVWDIFT